MMSEGNFRKFKKIPLISSLIKRVFKIINDLNFNKKLFLHLLR